MNIADLRLVMQRLREGAREVMWPDGKPEMSPAELVVLQSLCSSGRPQSISELVNETHFAQSRISTAVAALRERGWAQTTSDADDRRRLLVEASTEVTASITRAFEEPAEPVLRHLMPSATDEEIAAVLHGFEILASHLKTQEPVTR